MSEDEGDEKERTLAVLLKSHTHIYTSTHLYVISDTYTGSYIYFCTYNVPICT